MTFRKLLSCRNAILALAVVALMGAAALQAQQVADGVLKAEAERVAVVEKVKPAVVAVFGPAGAGGGSGVLISDDGYALTNFHVVAGPGAAMQCGLADGILYDAVLVGIDKVGDVGLIKLLPRPEQKDWKFPYVALGDSDKCREGDWSLAMGNPFLLATDFTPTVTYGLISGVHRYQYPSGTLLEYTDCIQIDTSINPGNSGGPLFNMKGELIGINGRGSFDKRARINSGVGYAISINQIKNFLGHLKSGLDSDHASLGATVTTQTDKTGIGRMAVMQILDSADVYRRGLTFGDELVSFDGRPIYSVNHLKNVMGLFPRGWRVPMEYRRSSGDEDASGARKEILVRLMGIQRKVLEEGDPKMPDSKGGPKGGGIKPPARGSPAAKFFIAKDGFANYWFNKEAAAVLMQQVKKVGDFSKYMGKWEFEGGLKRFKANTASEITIEAADEKAKEGTGIDPVVRLKISDQLQPYELYPQKQRQKDYTIPEGSGGLLAGLYLYRNFLIMGGKAFEGQFVHGGLEPCYPPSADRKKSLKDRKIMTEVINASSGPYLAKLFFTTPADKEAGRLVCLEVRMQENDDPCEIYFSNYKQLPGGQWMAHRLTVIYGDSIYGEMDFSGIKLGSAE